MAVKGNSIGVLDGKTALITGSSAGIGLASARAFVGEGAYVFINGRDQALLDAASLALQPYAEAVQGDVAKIEDLDRIFGAVGASGRKLDILYANAGAGGGANVADITEAHFDEIVGVNMRGTIFTVQKALPHLNDGASIILQGSIAGTRGRAGRTVYNASKAALLSFARTWAQEFADRKIRVNLLVPGPTNTRALAAAPKEVRDFLAGQVIRGTIAEPAEIALAAVFLASDASCFVNATEFFADGGAAQV